MDQKTIITYPIRGEFAATADWLVDMIGPVGAIGTLKAAYFHCDAVSDVDLRFRIGDSGDPDRHLDWTIPVADQTANSMNAIYGSTSLQGPFRNRILERDQAIQVRFDQTSATIGSGTFLFVVEWDLANPRMRPN